MKPPTSTSTATKASPGSSTDKARDLPPLSDMDNPESDAASDKHLNEAMRQAADEYQARKNRPK